MLFYEIFILFEFTQFIVDDEWSTLGRTQFISLDYMNKFKDFSFSLLLAVDNLLLLHCWHTFFAHFLKNTQSFPITNEEKKKKKRRNICLTFFISHISFGNNNYFDNCCKLQNFMLNHGRKNVIVVVVVIALLTYLMSWVSSGKRIESWFDLKKNLIHTQYKRNLTIVMCLT